GQEEFVVRRGDRIAQMVICPVVRVLLEEVQELTPTERGPNGFGSTGV
ncbi:MAG: dUTP diphosphatase, partial [Hydrogenobacter sp.]